MHNMLRLLKSGRVNADDNTFLFKLLIKCKFMNKALDLNQVNKLFDRLNFGQVKDVDSTDFYIDEHKAIILFKTDVGMRVIFINSDSSYKVYSCKTIKLRVGVACPYLSQETGELKIAEVLSYSNSFGRTLAIVNFNMKHPNGFKVRELKYY